MAVNLKTGSGTSFSVVFSVSDRSYFHP